MEHLTQILQVLQLILTTVLIPVCTILVKLDKKITEIELRASEAYVKKVYCSDCKKENRDTHRTIFERLEARGRR